MNQIWPRVFQRFCRTSVLQSTRNHSACVEHATVSAYTGSTHIKPTLLVSRLYQPSNLHDMGQDTRLQGEMTCKSQRLMLQAGLIHPSNPGCYYYLPATVRSMEKLVRLVFTICCCVIITLNSIYFYIIILGFILPLTVQMRVIDQEMQGIGGQKLDMPSLCSAELWKASERWDLMGKELLRLKDRHGGEYCLAPTHEEAVTTLVAYQTTLSHRQLPLLLYQVAS